jgi:hypothetical protein
VDASNATNDIVALQDATNVNLGLITELQGRTSAWNQAITDASAATNDIVTLQAATNTNLGLITELQGRTSAWNQAVTDSSGATNDIVALQEATNSLNTRVGDLETATNDLSGKVTGMEGNTSKWETAYTDSASATGNVVALQAATNAINANYYPRSNPSNFVTAGDAEPLWNADSNNVWVAINANKAATNAINIIANAALPKAGGTMTGPIDLGGQPLTNIGTFQLNGTVANGAVLVATNTRGEVGCWIPSKFRASKTDTQSFGTDSSKIKWNVTNFNVNSKFSDGTWTPGRAGYVLINTIIGIANKPSGRFTLYLKKDGATFKQHDLETLTAAYPTLQITAIDYCQDVTNSYEVWIYCGSIQTNLTAAYANSFEGIEIP